MSDGLHDFQVVTNKQVGETVFLLQRSQQVHQLRLNHVGASPWLVGLGDQVRDGVAEAFSQLLQCQICFSLVKREAIYF